MTDFAAISGTFADFKLVKTRSVAQLVVEIPIEKADAQLKMLGGVPQPGKEVPVAVARLNPESGRTNESQVAVEPSASQGAPNPAKAGECADKPAKTPFHQLPRAQQAGMLCGEGRFQEFLAMENTASWAYYGGANAGANQCEVAAEVVRDICGVGSRSELNEGFAADCWAKLHAEYEQWAGLTAECRE